MVTRPRCLLRLAHTVGIKRVSDNLAQGTDREPHVVSWPTVHDDFEIASDGSTDGSWDGDGGPGGICGIVVDELVLVGRSIPNTAAEIVGVLEGEGGKAGCIRVGEDLERWGVGLGLDSDETHETEGFTNVSVRLKTMRSEGLPLAHRYFWFSVEDRSTSGKAPPGSSQQLVYSVTIPVSLLMTEMNWPRKSVNQRLLNLSVLMPRGVAPGVVAG